MSTSRFSKASVLLFLVLLLPGVSGQGSHGLSDHHAFLAGLDEVPVGEFLALRIDHLYFRWATVWYSARVQEGPAIESFLVDGGNLTRFMAGGSFAVLPNSDSGPDTETGGLAAPLPTGLYYLVLRNAGNQPALVKWEIFLEPRLQGEPGGSSSEMPAPPLPWLLIVGIGAGGVAALGLVVLLLRRR